MNDQKPADSPLAKFSAQLHAAVEAATRKPLFVFRPRLRAVFDLDGTLFFNEARTAALMKTFAHLSCERPHVERICAAVDQRLAEGAMLYDPRANWLAVAGAQATENVQTWMSFWMNMFFQNGVLEHDVPAPGAQAFLRMIRGYLGRDSLQLLTGRHEASSDPKARHPQGMRLGTEAALWRHGFPSAELVCKPRFEEQDRDFKRLHFESMLTREPRHLPLVFVDNEPVIVDLYDRFMREAALPHVSVLFESPHTSSAELHSDVIVFSQFPDPASKP